MNKFLGQLRFVATAVLALLSSCKSTQPDEGLPVPKPPIPWAHPVDASGDFSWYFFGRFPEGVGNSSNEDPAGTGWTQVGTRLIGATNKLARARLVSLVQAPSPVREVDIDLGPMEWKSTVTGDVTRKPLIIYICEYSELRPSELVDANNNGRMKEIHSWSVPLGNPTPPAVAPAQTIRATFTRPVQQFYVMLDFNNPWHTALSTLTIDGVIVRNVNTP